MITINKFQEKGHSLGSDLCGKRDRWPGRTLRPLAAALLWDQVHVQIDSGEDVIGLPNADRLPVQTPPEGLDPILAHDPLM